MLNWKQESDGKTALLIEGARRIGKSTVVEEFAKKEYESYILIDFAKASSDVKALFDDISDLNYLFLQLQLQYRVDLHERKSVIIFDEVQLCPKARQAIKALVEDHRYDYIETGSLISIKKNVKDILIPSEERRLNMYPMDYEEFLWAVGDQTTFSLLAKCYESDFAKIDATGRLAMLFDAIPAELNKNAARYQVNSVLGGEKIEKVLELIAELKDSKTVLVSYNVNDPNAGMSNTKDLSRFKLFLCDTGLFVTLMFKDRDFTENEIYEKLLSDKLSVNLGYLYENAVACCLAVNGNELFYHTIMNETSKHNYEIDFLLAKKNKIIPIEVKSSGYKTHKSLDVFTEKFSDRILCRYLVYTKDISKEQDIFYIPVYMVPFL